MPPRFGTVVLILIVLATACGGDSSKPNATPTPMAPSGPTPTSTPTYEGSIKPGAWVRVAGVDGCLNLLFSAGLSDAIPVNYCQPNGYEGYVAGAPVFSDGHWWWEIAGQGWTRDDFLQFVRSEDLERRMVPELGGLGQIAYVGADGGIWVMDADGSEKTRLVEPPAAGSDTYIGSPQWRPDGQQLLYETSHRGRDQATFDLRIIDLNGRPIRTIPNVSSASWSPDGTRLGLLAGIVEIAINMRATPAVLDLATGGLTSIGPLVFYVEGPKWRPNGQELVLENEEGLSLAQADGSGGRLLMASTDLAGRVPNWSPDGTTLSLQGYGDGCEGYILYNVDAGATTLCAPVPPGDTRRGGRGGWSEDGQTDWSPDGRLFAYHTEWGVVDTSGVYIVDAVSGEQTLLPGWASAYTGFAPDNQLVVFETHNGGHSFIWAGNAETGEVTLLTEGSQPVWRPVID